MGGLYGVREGTIISALAVGAIVGLFNRLFSHFEKFCPIKGHLTLTATTMASPEEIPSKSSEDGATHQEEDPAQTLWLLPSRVNLDQVVVRLAKL